MSPFQTCLQILKSCHVLVVALTSPIPEVTLLLALGGTESTQNWPNNGVLYHVKSFLSGHCCIFLMIGRHCLYHSLFYLGWVTILQFRLGCFRRAHIVTKYIIIVAAAEVLVDHLILAMLTLRSFVQNWILWAFLVWCCGDISCVCFDGVPNSNSVVRLICVADLLCDLRYSIQTQLCKMRMTSSFNPFNPETGAHR